MELQALADTREVPVIGAGARAPATVDPDVPRTLGRVSAEEISSAVGALVGSFAGSYLLYFDILPLSGIVGFVVCWYLSFMLMYAGLTALNHPRTVVIDRLARAVVMGVALLVGFVLATVVVYTVLRGHKALTHTNFYTKSASAGSLTGPFDKGGISNAIVGSLIMVGLAVCIALPLGIGTAVYMTEVGGWFARLVRTVVEAMTAVPDLLAGLFVYAFLILGLHGHKNGLAATIALSVTGTPIVARSAEVALRVVPGGLREASLALGSTHWKTVRHIVIPTALPSLATALILAVARMIGESAPLLIVSGFTTYWNTNPLSSNPMNSLPLYIYEGIRSGQPNFVTRAFGAAVVLLAMVFVLFLVTRVLARRRAASR